jgi:hypothetical protein
MLTLTAYFLRQLVFSLAGVLYILLSLVFWRIFFDPTQRTPEIAYYVLVIGLFGGGAAFLITLSTTSRANRALNYPILARLPSRVEHLTAALLAALLFTWLLQFLVAVLALFRGPAFSFVHFLEIPPLWIAVDVLAVALALHASDLVSAGWSRVYVFGLLAVFLFGQGVNSGSNTSLARLVSTLSSWFYRQGWVGLGNQLTNLSQRLLSSETPGIAGLFDLLFWPFHAINDAVITGSFRPSQALAPALLLLYATLLFLLAANLFAGKDLYLTE